MNTPEEFATRCIENLGNDPKGSAYIYGTADNRPFFIFMARGDLAREMHPVMNGITRIARGNYEGVAVPE
jgi:hypothetical protein